MHVNQRSGVSEIRCVMAEIITFLTEPHIVSLYYYYTVLTLNCYLNKPLAMTCSNSLLFR